MGKRLRYQMIRSAQQRLNANRQHRLMQSEFEREVKKIDEGVESCIPKKNSKNT